MNAADLTFQKGLPERYRTAAAALYDEAFSQKLSIAIGSDQKRLSLLEACLSPDFAIVAITGQQLAGIAGFHTPAGSFTGGLFSGGVAYRHLVSRLGLFAGSWAALLFSLYERKTAPGELLMDGIAVRHDLRGRAIGSRLLDEIASYARQNNFDRVRLDVIDANHMARKLYERKGFRAVKTHRLPYLRWLLGFGGYTTMRLDVWRSTVKPSTGCL